MFEATNAKLVAGAALLGVAAFSADTADAALMMKLESGASTVNAVDGGAGDIDLATNGSLVVLAPVGVFSTTVSTGLGAPVIGTTSVPELHLDNVSVSSGGAGVLTISLTMTDLIGPVGNASTLFSTGGVSGGDVTVSAYLDNSNAAYGTATLLGTYNQGLSGSFSTDIAKQVTTDDEYSLTIIAVIEHAGVGVTSFDADVDVPEPGSLALLGLGGLLVARRRRG